MSTRSVNKVILIGNLTRDPELRYTPQGTAVCTFGLATNRSWMPSGGEERQEEVEFHRIVAWQKLAELCAQLLFKGRKTYVEGRLQTREWAAADGSKQRTTEVVADTMIVLDNKRKDGMEPVEGAPQMAGQEMVAAEPSNQAPPTDEGVQATPSSTANLPADDQSEEEPSEESKTTKKEAEKKPEAEEKVKPEDLPF